MLCILIQQWIFPNLSFIGFNEVADPKGPEFIDHFLDNIPIFDESVEQSRNSSILAANDISLEESSQDIRR